ncbi:MAG: Sensor histidine kinase [Clostridia bacterium]|nr:Sensor histidine kinase [Clostridia bacterium]
MDNKVRVKYLHWFIYVINLLIIAFLSINIYRTSYRICYDFKARSFLESAQYLPLVPSTIPIYTVFLMLVLGISTVTKNYINQKNRYIVIASVVVDIVICIYISYYLNYSYKGIFLFLAATILLYVQLIDIRIFLLIITLISYILLDYDLLSVNANIVSFQNYINYYPEQVRVYLYSIKNILTSLNEILFFFLVFLLLQAKIKENKIYLELNNQLKVANEKLENYAKESEQIAKMKERNRLAREIHDILGHSLTGIATGLEASIELLEVNFEVAKNQLFKIQEIAKKGLVDVRRSVKELKIDAIEKYELIPAIEKLIEERNQFSNTNVTLVIEGEVMRMNADEEQTIYRVVQESVTNAIRHGKAHHIWVKISFGYYQLDIVITDDGVGCGEISKGFGLTHIEERIKMLNGTVEFNSTTDGGFTTKLLIPIRWGNAYD